MGGFIEASASLIDENLIVKGMGFGIWEDVEKAATLMFKMSVVNKVRVEGLKLLQKLYRFIPDGHDPGVKKLYDSLFEILTRSSKSSPTLVHNIDKLLGLLCKFSLTT